MHPQKQCVIPRLPRPDMSGQISRKAAIVTGVGLFLKTPNSEIEAGQFAIFGTGSTSAPTPLDDRRETAVVYRLHAQAPVCARPSIHHPLSPLRNKGHDRAAEAHHFQKPFTTVHRQPLGKCSPQRHREHGEKPQCKSGSSPLHYSSRGDRTKRNYFLLLFLFTVHCSLFTEICQPLTGHEIDDQTEIDPGYYVAEEVIFGYNQGRCKDERALQRMRDAAAVSTGRSPASGR